MANKAQPENAAQILSEKQKENTMANEAHPVNAALKERLGILYEYEQKYLELTKNYKEEIKFAASLQEDLRKERAKFFAETVKEVYKTLNEAQVKPEVIAHWLAELVGSYTKSLDISADLSKDHILEMLGILKESAAKDMAQVSGNADGNA